MNFNQLKQWRQRLFGNRRRTVLSLAVLVFVPIVVVQLLWPGWVLIPNTTVGSVNVGGKLKPTAAAMFDEAYATTKVPIYFSDSKEVVIEPTLSELGIMTDNQGRVDAYKYPFWARLLPYSLFWYQAVMAKGEPQVVTSSNILAKYISAHFGETCDFAPVNATIVYKDGSLRVVSATRGGSCDPSELHTALESVTAQLSPAAITINGTSTAPEISTAVATDEYNRLVKVLEKDIKLKVGDKTDKIPKETAAQWVVYSVQGGKLVLGVNNDTATTWLTDRYGKKYNTPAGTTVVNVVDYAEKDRTTGVSGQSLNSGKTQAEVVATLAGKKDEAALVVDTIEPAVQYTRSYSPSNEALSNVMKQYAQSHTGTYKVKMVELSGARRNAEYQSTGVLTTASTYKLFVAYSILLRIERGELSWGQASYGGYTLSTCFDRMIELSNNECALSLLAIAGGYSAVQADARAMGATHTTFSMSDGISSTPADEAYFLSMLYTGQILSQQSSRDKLITAMKGNVYVAGIPSGIPNATIADKVGFLYGLLHDAAIVYSPKGDYVLVIMTDNATWANIAELAGKIEAAR